MSATNATENSVLEHVLHTGGTLYISLHTADPTDAGNQGSSEATYTGYARVAINGNSTDLPVASGAATNASTITFGKATAGTETITHVGIGTASTGAGSLILSNPLSSSLSITAGVTPLFEVGGFEVTCD